MLGVFGEEEYGKRHEVEGLGPHHRKGFVTVFRSGRRKGPSRPAGPARQGGRHSGSTSRQEEWSPLMRRAIPEPILGLDGTHAVGGQGGRHMERGEGNDRTEAARVVLHEGD
jgi:hypothetical protein